MNMVYLKKINRYILWIGVVLFLLHCNKQTIPPQFTQPPSPTGLKLSSGYNFLVATWEPRPEEKITGYYVYFGTKSRCYSDTIYISGRKTHVKINNLNSDQCYYCAVASVDRNKVVSEPSAEAVAFPYLYFDGFSQSDGTLDSLTWYCNVGYQSRVIDGKVLPVETVNNGATTMRSFAQYLRYTPNDNFVVECQFKLGIPNVGGAGIIIRSQMANPDNFYKGYYAYLFWDINNWYLHLEESQLDKYALRNDAPKKLPPISPDEWIKLSVKYYHGNMTIEAIRLSDYSLLGKITIKEKPWSRRPLDSDVFCGFFTTQYGKNKILVDNFGISRYLPDKPFYDQ